MMWDDKKKVATVVLSRIKDGKQSLPEEKPTNEAGDEVDASAGLDSAAEELIAAIHSKDASSVKEALRSFMELCDSEESDESEEESE